MIAEPSFNAVVSWVEPDCRPGTDYCEMGTGRWERAISVFTKMAVLLGDGEEVVGSNLCRWRCGQVSVLGVTGTIRGVGGLRFWDRTSGSTRRESVPVLTSG
jgi:hypothetical protein